MVLVVIGTPPNSSALGSIRRLRAFRVRTTKGCASVVPMKFESALVPLLPVRDHASAEPAGP
jgi:hypothetical protein